MGLPVASQFALPAGPAAKDLLPVIEVVEEVLDALAQFACGDVELFENIRGEVDEVRRDNQVTSGP